MKKRLYLVIYILAALLSPQHVEAQDNNESRQIYLQAEEEYQVGRLEQALKLLQTNINDFDGNLKQNAYRLIALCYLAQDNTSQTETYAKLLLQENPYYTSIQDPVRFEDMIKRLKTGRSATVTTASSQAESINEAPVPVTIITAEMIEMLGYNKNLNQILAAYIPGVSEVASTNLDNIAMHGAYTASQENILIMENGHRLNTRSTNLGRTDYAINTQKIDHIEVLRGPASSLYGNVALTAVVNIITKDGTSVNGLSAQYGYGSLHTHKADLLAGTHFMNCDVFAWASLYSSAGEDRYIPASQDQSLDIYRVAGPPSIYGGYAHINKYTEKPSYDVGVNIKLNDFNLMFSRKSGKKTQQYSVLAHAYDYDAYRWFDGQKPGYCIEENHANLTYNKTFGKFSLNASVYGDWYDINDYGVASDAMIYPIFNDDGTAMKDENGNDIYGEYIGAYQIYDWKEMTLGASLRGDYNYTLGSMKGNILAGMQFEYFSLYDTYGLLGEKFDSIQIFLSERNNTIISGRENNISFFLQDKHYFTPRLILNAGIRFDSKYRTNGARINALSPRLAFIYTPSRELSMKLSYSRSFVDAPYFYRLNTDNTYRGSIDLKPEYLNAIQFNVLGEIFPINLTYDVNLFYNRFSDIMYSVPDAGIEDAKYRNSGKLETIGAECALHYNSKRLKANLTASHTRLLNAKDYPFRGHHIYAVPDFINNIQLMYDVLAKTNHHLWLTANAKINSKFYVQVQDPTLDDMECSGNTIFDLGARYQMGKHMTLQINCENVFDKTTYMSGATLIVMPWYNPGRTVLASIKYNL
jgi:iron complex outermembrane receptor protein